MLTDQHPSRHAHADSPTPFSGHPRRPPAVLAPGVVVAAASILPPSSFAQPLLPMREATFNTTPNRRVLLRDINTGPIQSGRRPLWQKVFPVFD